MLQPDFVTCQGHRKKQVARRVPKYENTGMGVDTYGTIGV